MLGKTAVSVGEHRGKLYFCTCLAEPFVSIPWVIYRSFYLFDVSELMTDPWDPANGAEARPSRGAVHVQGAPDGAVDSHHQLPQASRDHLLPGKIL